MCSGILQIQYERFSDFSGLGISGKRFRNKIAETYGESVKYFRDMSIIDAISEEKSKTIPFDNVDNVQMNCNYVDIMTDARHACRKNSFNSDITALGQITHKVLSYQHVTKRLERNSQKHELYGTKKLYEDLESKTVNVRCHSHDRNSSISSFIEKDKPNVIDCLDTWHAGKEVRKAITKVAKGAKKNME
ncbi:unnamed protein product [Mytilus coruscus]|uniref:Uncharacterized protein n=1 Tax=Mytilus coruscus TaxID=42192 RepID=A0A6J8BZL7_MYTCO|nr:unnamed protein product [Mytilus coruscus]